MRNNDLLKIGEKIDVQIDEDNQQYLSRVEDVIDESTLIITRPIGREKYTYLTEGQIIKVLYTRDDGLYYFNATVVDRIKSGKSISAKVEIISERYKIQRRNYFRLTIMVGATIYIKDDTQPGGKLKKRMDAVDISGGGIRLTSDYQFKVNEEIGVSLNIQGIENEIINSKVVRSMLSSKYKDMYDIGVEFININSKTRQTIIKFIFTKQREILKKEK